MHDNGFAPLAHPSDPSYQSWCFQARTYSMLNVEGKSASSGMPNQSGMVSLSKMRQRGWRQCVF
jgi:hypothetical protein